LQLYASLFAIFLEIYNQSASTLHYFKLLILRSIIISVDQIILNLDNNTIKLKKRNTIKLNILAISIRSLKISTIIKKNNTFLELRKQNKLLIFHRFNTFKDCKIKFLKLLSTLRKLSKILIIKYYN